MEQQAGTELDPTGRPKQQAETEEAHERSAPGGAIVYKAILMEGEEELSRSSAALFWSGLAAGLSMGFSMIAEGLLATYLPDASWRPLVAKFGYSAGFLIVILGRQQLFTENTLTPILPLLVRRDWAPCCRCCGCGRWCWRPTWAGRWSLPGSSAIRPSS